MVLVDDKSTDNSLNIAEELVAKIKYSFIKKELMKVRESVYMLNTYQHFSCNSTW